MPNHYLAELERKKNKKKAKRGDNNEQAPATDAKGAFGRGGLAQTAEGGRRSSLAGQPPMTAQEAMEAKRALLFSAGAEGDIVPATADGGQKST